MSNWSLNNVKKEIIKNCEEKQHSENTYIVYYRNCAYYLCDKCRVNFNKSVK